MATPVLARIASTALGTAVGGGTGSFLSPGNRSIAYSSNWLTPNLLPELSSLISAYNQNMISFDIFQKTGYYLGAKFLSSAHEPGLVVPGRFNYTIQWDGNAQQGTPWDTIAWTGAFRPSLDLLLEMWRRGYIDRSLFTYWCERLAITNEGTQELMRKVSKYLPPVQDIIRFLVKEVYNPEQRTLLQLDAEYGQNREFIAWASALGLTGVEILGPDGRMMIKDVAADYWAAHWQLPSPTQVFEMLFRLRPGRNTRYWTNDFFPAAVDFDFVRQTIKALDYSPTWRDRLAAIAYKLPGRVDIRRMMGTQVITRDEAKEYYKDLGYAEPDAENLTKLAQKIAFWKPTLPRAVKWFNMGAIGLDRLTAVFESHSVPQDYRQIVVDTATPTIAVAKLQKWLQRKWIDNEAFTREMKRHGMPIEQIEMYRFEALSIPWSKHTQATRERIKESAVLGIIGAEEAKERLKATGLSDAEAEAAINVISFEFRAELARKAIAAARKGFLRGEFTIDRAQQMLLDIGVSEFRIQQLAALWSTEFDAGRRQLSARQVIDALSRGLISIDVARIRLRNLTYDERAIDILLSVGVQNIQKAVALAVLRAERAEKERIRAAKQLLRENRAEQDRARQELLRHGTPAMLKTWLKQGLINQDEVRSRLCKVGWPPDDIDRLVSEAGGTANGEPCPPPNR